MPPTERKKLRREVSDLLFEIVMLGEVDGTEDQREVDELLDLNGLLASCRYLNQRNYRQRSSACLDRFISFRDDEFFQTLRVTRRTFDFLGELIGDDHVFQNKSHNKQRLVSVQLAVALEWYGAHGNGNSVGRVSREFKIGTGTLSTYVRRVQRALLRHYDRFVMWPSATRRITSAVYHRERFGLDGVVGMVDGTHVIFDQKPAVDGGLHFNRKSRYSFNVQVVCDEDQRILFIYTGWPGSTADSSMFSKTPIVTNPERFFSDGEYLLGDSGYAISPRLIVPYKRPAADRDENAFFNETLSSARVVNENCIGRLKNRWMSLKGIRTQLNLKKDFIHVNNHVFACAMLHNIGIILDDPWYDEERDDEDEEAAAQARDQQNEASTEEGKRKREELKQALLLREGR